MAAGDLNELMSCSVQTAGFRVTDFAFSESAILDDKDGRTGRAVKIDVDGEIKGADATELATNIGLFLAALRLRDGVDFVVKGLGGTTEIGFLAASMIDGGPWVSGITVDKQLPKGALLKPVKFTVSGKQNRTDPSGGGDPTDPTNSNPTSVKVTTATRADGMRQISYEGKFSGANATSNYNTYTAAKRATFPADLWVEAKQRVSAFDDTQLDFTLAYTELATQMQQLGPGFTIIDMEARRTAERSENYRKVITGDYDVLIAPDGNPQEVLDAFRQVFLGSLNTPEGLRQPTILRENFSYTAHHEKRVKCTFTVLQGADGNDLLEWEQTMQSNNHQGQHVQSLKAFEFIGRAPVVVRAAIAAASYTQSGRAVGVNRWPQPPAPFWGPENLARPPVVQTRYVNSVERETVWSYEFLFASARTLTRTDYARLQRPVGNAVLWLDNNPQPGGAGG